MKKTLTILIITVLVTTAVYFARLDRLAASANIASLGTMAGMDLWQGNWLSEKTKKSGDFQVVFQKKGSELTGSIRIGGSPLTRGGDIKGTINGDKLEFGLIKDKKGRLKYTGTISEDTMAGIWQIPAIKDHGTWQATKESRDTARDG
jgi:hypothetical protein